MQMMTQGQIRRKERNEKIVARFKELREENPAVSTERICEEISRAIKTLNTLSIRLICKKAGVC